MKRTINIKRKDGVRQRYHVGRKVKRRSSWLFLDRNLAPQMISGEPPAKESPFMKEQARRAEARAALLSGARRISDKNELTSLGIGDMENESEKQKQRAKMVTTARLGGSLAPLNEPDYFRVAHKRRKVRRKKYDVDEIREMVKEQEASREWRRFLGDLDKKVKGREEKEKFVVAAIKPEFQKAAMNPVRKRRCTKQ